MVGGGHDGDGSSGDGAMPRMVRGRSPPPARAGGASGGGTLAAVSGEDVSAGHLARRSLGIFGGLTVTCACLTILFLSMRSVMSIGGYCASGGPYEIAVPCPEHVPMLMVGSIWIGLGGLLLYSVSSYTTGGPRLFLLAWPALFLSLGWNFLEFGLDPPGDQNLEWSWLFCAVLFFVMGGAPLVLFLKPDAAARMIWGPPGPDGEPPPRAPSWATHGVRVAGQSRGPSGVTHTTIVVDPMATAGTSPRPVTVTSTPEPEPDVDGDLVDKLERLAALHRRGALTTEEYTAAKQALLSEEGP